MEKYQQVYDTVCEMICDAKDLEQSDLSPEMPLYQLKLDSLDYVELMVLVRCDVKCRDVYGKPKYDTERFVSSAGRTEVSKNEQAMGISNGR